VEGSTAAADDDLSVIGIALGQRVSLHSVSLFYMYVEFGPRFIRSKGWTGGADVCVKTQRGSVVYEIFMRRMRRIPCPNEMVRG
jgi:hypothetical protein